MKKSIITVIAVLAVISLLCTGAFAQGKGPGGGGQTGGTQQSGSQPPDGQNPPDGKMPQGGAPTQNNGDQQFAQNGQMQGEPMNVNTDAIANAISQLEDEDTAAALTALLDAYTAAAAGDDTDAQRDALQALRDALAAAGLQNNGGEPMNNTFSNNFGREYGRFLDVDAVAEAIAALSDTDSAASLTALLTAYETAVNGDDPKTTQDALQALLDGIAAAELEVDGYTGLQLNKTSQGQYLDTDAVAEAVAALSDTDTAAALTILLGTYEDAVAGGDAQAVRDAFTALMDALAAAGVQVKP